MPRYANVSINYKIHYQLNFRNNNNLIRIMFFKKTDSFSKFLNQNFVIYFLIVWKGSLKVQYMLINILNYVKNKELLYY
jgi:hypothetical protein